MLGRFKETVFLQATTPAPFPIVIIIVIILVVLLIAIVAAVGVVVLIVIMKFVPFLATISFSFFGK